GGDEGALVPVLLDERPRPRGGPVVDRDGVAVPGEVAREVAAHDRQSGDADLGECSHAGGSLRARRRDVGSLVARPGAGRDRPPGRPTGRPARRPASVQRASPDGDAPGRTLPTVITPDADVP